MACRSLAAPGVTDQGQQPKLLDRVREAIRMRHYSRRTEEAYVYWIRRFIVFHRKAHPSTMGAAEISTFLTWLAVRQHVSASTQNQALSALLFLYRGVLGVDVGTLSPTVRARTPERLPVVLSRAEVTAVLNALAGTMKLFVLVLYGAGLRLQECLDLRVKDIDFDRNEILVRRGKGQKDRRTPLPGAVKEGMRAHLQAVKGQHVADLARGEGRVVLPFALDRKVSEGCHGMGLAVRLPGVPDLPRSTIRAVLSLSSARICGSARRGGGGTGGGNLEARDMSFISALVRDALTGRRV